jgi:cullin-associated NEDD8-dissociated protein 1
LLSKYGRELAADAEKIQKAVLLHITSKHSATKKKAISCLGLFHVQLTTFHTACPDFCPLGFVSTISSEKQFVELMEYLLAQIKKAKKATDVRTYVQTIGSLSRAVGGRMGKQLDKVIATVIKYVDAEEYEEDDELKEICFQTFESLIYRCPKEIAEFLGQIIPLALKYLKHDPNYAGDSDDDAMDVDEDEDEDDDDDDDGDMSDDDDMSWKVRKACSRCLCAIVRTRPEMLSELYQKVAPQLVARFSGEREENVKLDVFTTFTALLNQTTLLLGATGGAGGPMSALQDIVPKIVTGLSKQLKDKKTKPQTRIGIYGVLRQLVQAVPGVFSKNVGDILAGLHFSFDGKNTSSPLKTETLVFLRALLSSHPASAFHANFKSISGPVYKAVADSYYKINAEALRVCTELVKVLRPNLATSEFDFKPHVKQLFEVTQEKFNTNDIDQEVKEEAINCIALVVSRLGDELTDKLPALFKVLVERLRNEITRLTTVKAFGEIAGSPLKLDLSAVLGDVIKELATFLRKQNRQLKQQTLNTLTIIVQNYGSDKSAQAHTDDVLTELANLVSDSEMHLAHLALRLSSVVLTQNPKAADTITSAILPPTFTLLTSSLLQGLALESLQGLLGAMLQTKAKGLSFDTLLDSLVNLVTKRGAKDEALARSSYAAIGQSIATLVHAAPADKQQSTVTRFLADVKSGKGDSSQLLAVYAIGEIGRRVDLSANKEIKKSIIACFESSNEDVKSAASVALGGFAVGNLEKFLPEILAEVDAEPKRQYMLLGSIREVVVSQSRSEEGAHNLSKFFDQFAKLLFSHTASEEEGTRNIVAECLGKLALIQPVEVIAQLKERTKDGNSRTRATVVSALKFAILERSNPKVDEVLSSEFATFLALLKDSATEVRHAALLTFNYAIHHKPQLVRGLLDEYLPVLYGETKIKPELIIEVELGPFKHKVDNGQPLRQAAFECMYTLLDTCLDRIEFSAFTQQVKEGLADHFDIRMLNHLLLSKMAHRASAPLVHSLEFLVEPLRNTITTKVKDTAVQHERDRNDELIRSALRAVASISRIVNLEENQKWADFMKGTILQAGTKEIYDKIAKEVAESAAH